jgi:hypothetical protein
VIITTLSGAGRNQVAHLILVAGVVEHEENRPLGKQRTKKREPTLRLPRDRLGGDAQIAKQPGGDLGGTPITAARRTQVDVQPAAGELSGAPVSKLEREG